MNSPRVGLVVRGAALVLGLAALVSPVSRAAQRTATAPIEGLREASPRVHALVGGRIVVAPGRLIERGTIVLRDGVIEAVGADVTPPADARVWDVAGKTLYAGFIESDTAAFLPEAWKPPAPRPPGQEAPPAPAKVEPPTGAHAWNPRITPERMAARALTADPKAAEKLRALGFTLANAAPARGIFRGSGALVSTGAAGFNGSIVREATTQEVAFEFNPSYTERSYPTSLMGSIALTRQTLLDAQWYAATQAAYAKAGGGIERPEANDALAALGPVIRGEQTAMFELNDELDVARVLKIAGEFKLSVALRGVNTEYRVRAALAKAGVTVVLPLDFPDVPEVESPDRSVDVSLQELQQWELAPANAARLAEAGVPVAFTSAKLKKPEAEFWPRVRKAAARGLGEDRALAALTTVPAGLLGVAATQGTLEKGKAANVVVASGDLFKADDAAIELLMIDGDPFEQEAWQRLDARGTWQLGWSGAAKGPAEVLITRAPKLAAKVGDKPVPVTATDRNSLLFFMPAELFGATGGTVRVSASGRDGELTGTGELPDGTVVRLTAKRAAAKAGTPAAEKKPPVAEKFIATADTYPAGAFGRKALPAQPDAVLFQHATVWTSGPAGVIEDGDVLVTKGRIAQVGQGLAAPAGALVIDATGKHISPGIVDCHSHTAISRGVNEVGSVVTVEVRIGDVIDPTDIAIYRELAGGVTTANVLHGSANPIGGQNQVIKLRWGADAEAMKFAGAKPGVKFALGENVVQAYLTGPRSRYPLSRMGVPEIMLDSFNRARDYERAWADYRAGRAALPPRRDLRLEGVAEILHGDRIIHIHSYRQDEVLAFIRLAEEQHLPVATFQHILEGYKVAPEIAKLGAGGSTFSDWWAYKFEVYDAIPYNGVLMHDAGITVSFNSDSGELARRLNTEAAKAMKYGGLSAPEALKFVTINPAKQLRIDGTVGSLEPGKDADLVVWNGSPLSTLSRAEQTWIDGRRYFDREEDAQLRATAAKERSALLQKALAERQKTLAGGSDPGGGDAPPAAPALVAEEDHDHDEYRAIYHNGSDVHNCSTHEGGR